MGNIEVVGYTTTVKYVYLAAQPIYLSTYVPVKLALIVCTTYM